MPSPRLRAARATGALLVLLLSPRPSFAQPLPPEAPVPSPDADKAEAKASFDRGISLFDAGAYDAALAEFQQSRRLFPTRAATRNAALALHKLHRFDEALDLVDELLRDAALSEADRPGVARERDELSALVGTISVSGPESDATVIVDGTERGRTPLAGPVRVATGSHVVRVYKEGFTPFEVRVDVAGRENAVVVAKLGALVRGGRLSVSEDRGTTVSVVVDGVAVGKTPWEGTLPIGAHTVWLRADAKDEEIGSPPAAVEVRLNQLTRLSLVAEPLPCSVRVLPTPLSARVAVDGVDLGTGVWSGALRCGGHVVELAAEGFLPATNEVALSKGTPGLVTTALERDPTSPMWRAANPPRVTVDARGGTLIGGSIGGDLSGGGRGIAFGGAVQGGVGYQLGIGVGIALDLGFVTAGQSVTHRPASAFPVGLAAEAGEASDDLQLAGPTLGLSVAFERGKRLVWMGRLGTGVVLGTWSDARTGSFTTAGGTAYSAPSLTETGASQLVYLNPEARVGWRFGDHLIAELGAQLLGLISVTSATWSNSGNSALFHAGQCPSPNVNTCAGLAEYGPARVVGSTVFFLPTVGLRYEL